MRRFFPSSFLGIKIIDSSTNKIINRLNYYMIFSWIHPLIKRAWNNEQFSLNELYSIINSDESEELTDQLEK